MPEGQYSGARKTYIYQTDNNDQKFLLSLDATLGDLAGTGLVAATTANVADATPKPQRFTPRCVYWQGTLNDRPVRKKVVCGTTASTLYNKNVTAALTIDGVAGSTTGRAGEKLTFPSIPTAGGGA